MKKILAIFLICILLSGCSSKFQRISFDKNTLGNEIENHLNAETQVISNIKSNIPSQIPLYTISERTIKEQDFVKMKQQLNLPNPTSSWHNIKLDNNKIDGWFADFGTGEFTMSEKELEELARNTFNSLPFIEGEYEYSGIRGQDTLSSSDGEIVTRVLVSFYKLLDNVRVVGNERCDMWFNDSGLVEIHIEQYNYENTGFLDMLSVEDAKNHIKTPDSFSLDDTKLGTSQIVSTLQVDRLKLLLVNQFSNGCTVLQPVYNFIGTATMDDSIQTEFSSKIIAIPESYTYEKE